MTIPAFYQAANDPAIRRRALRVYLALQGELDVMEYRFVKQDYIATATGLRQPEVSLALKELCEAGYLQAVTEKKFRAKYRLFYSCSNSPTSRVG
ncbi:MAG: hypothetical protein H0U85_06185 [Gemmatimonadales bacterium]|nr:hypothetical protein [Gemmatimonadales bacterium]